MYFAIATHIFVHSPEKSAAFLHECLDFQTQYKEGYGWCAENGAVSLLIQEAEQTQAVLEIQCNHLAEDADKLLENSSIQALSYIEQDDHRMQQRLISACGITLILSQILTEDDLGELPDLPKSLPWDEATTLHVQRILRIVPLGFRSKVRQRVTERAEYLAVEGGDLMVNENYAMRALVDVTLKFQHPAMYEAMQKEGIDTQIYKATPCCD